MADDYPNSATDISQPSPAVVNNVVTGQNPSPAQDERFNAILQDVKESAVNPMADTINFYHEQLANKRLAAQGFHQDRIDPDKSDYENISKWKGDIGQFVMQEAIAKSPSTMNDLVSRYAHAAKQGAVEGFSSDTPLTSGGVLTPLVNLPYQAFSSVMGAASGIATQLGVEHKNPDIGYDLNTAMQAVYPEIPHLPVLAENAAAMTGLVAHGADPHSFVNPTIPMEDARAVRNGIYENTPPEVKAEAAQVADTARPAAEIAEDRQIEALQAKIEQNPQKSDVYQAQIDRIRAVRQSREPLPPTINDVAYKLSPETFNEENNLLAERATLREQIGNPEERRAQAEESASHNEEIKTLQDALENEKNKSGQRKLRAQIRDLETQKAAGVDEAMKDTPELAAARQRIQSINERLADLAPARAEAYRKAKEMMPQAETAPAEAQPFAPPPQEKNLEQQIFNIASDVKEKLMAAGRTAEQAEHESHIIAARYETAAAKGWTPGTAGEIYQKHMAQIIATRSAKNRIPELAQTDKTVAGDQSVIPGAEKISDKELAERKMQESLKSKKSQKAMDVGLFGEEMKQGSLFQKARGSVVLASMNAGKGIIKLMKNNDASTFMHEMAHHWLDEMVSWEKQDDAPADLKGHMAAVRKWLGTDSGEFSGFSREQHEKWARGFERYLRDGIAPSRELANAFAHFKAWLSNIYQTVKRLKVELSPEVTKVFDNMLAVNPEKIHIAPEHEAGKILAGVHERDVAETPPERADHVGDKVADEIDKHIRTHEPEIHHAIKTAEASSIAGTAKGGAGHTAERGLPGTQGAAAQRGAITEGGGGAAAKGASARGIYEPVPRKPLSLAEWIRKKGGLKDAGGDVKSILGGGKNNGLIRPKAGKNLDDLALQAWEDGYFPEKGERASINELLDKLKEDLTGNPQYSHRDEKNLADYHDALARNSEIDRLAHEFGIETKDKTAKEFWNEFTEKKSRAEQDRIAGEIEEARKSEEAEAEKKAKEWAQSRGEAWEPEETKTRTLEDLENEWKQESAAAKPQPGETGAGTPGVAAGHTEPVQGGAGQVGGASGDAGRAGESAATERGRANDAAESKPSKPIADLFTEPKKGEELRAGNIRVENLTTGDDAIAAMCKLAKENPDNFNHAVTSDLAVAEMAQAMGVKEKEVNLQKLREIAVDNDVPLAALVRSVRETFVELEKNVSELATKVDGGTEADLINFIEAKNRFRMVGETVSGITYEVGLALRAFRDISGNEMEKASQLETLLQQDMGSTPADMRQLAKLIASRTERAAAAKIIKASEKPGFWDHFAAYRRCSILSGFLTHALWLGGTTFNLAYKPLVLDTLGGIENKIGMAVGRPDTGSEIFGGAKGLAFAITKALPNIISATGTALKTGKTVLRPYEGERDTYLATGGIRKVLNVNMEELKKATDSAFSIADYPELKAMQDRIADLKDKPEQAANLQAKLDAQSEAKKALVAQKIAAQMQSRLKTWGDLAGEMHDFGTSALSTAFSIGKNMVSSEYYKNAPMFEARRTDVLPDIFVKGIPVLPVRTVMEGMSNRIYSTIHTFARELAANIEVVQEARRSALAEGLRDEDVGKRVQELLTDPTKPFMQRVTLIVNKQTLMSNESGFAKLAVRMRNSIDEYTGTKIGSVLLPVVGIPAEATHQTVIESSPLGLLNSRERSALKGDFGAVEQERAVAKMVAGTALIGLGMYLGSRGVTTPSPSVNYKVEQERKDAGKQSGSVRVGDTMVNLQHLPITGTLLTAGADLYHIMHVASGTDQSEKLKPAVASAVNNFLLHENSFVELASVVDAMRGKDDVASFMKNFAVSTIVPQSVKQFNDLHDPVQRESKSFMSGLLSKIPGESQDISPRINALTGEPVTKEPFHTNTAIPDPIADKLMNMGIYPANPHPVINGIDLTPKQGAEYSSIKGHILHNGLQMLIEGEGAQDFNDADTNEKHKMYQKIERHASQCAKSYMFNRHPELLKDANDKYEASCINESF